jgi:hypothetical protein
MGNSEGREKACGSEIHRVVAKMWPQLSRVVERREVGLVRHVETLRACRV